MKDATENVYPMRLNRYLALKGYATRRGADQIIAQGLVTINGKKAVLGSKVAADDTVIFKKKPGLQKSLRYFAYHKPRGVITHSPGEGEQDIRDVLGSSIPMDVFPLGRLDKDSSGLIILTNDGRITDRLLNPEREHIKEYVVQTRNNVNAHFKKIIERGVNIEGYITKPCTVKLNDDREFTIRLIEGKKHQIRRMCAALQNDVVRLRRTRIMNVELGKLAPGDLRPIEDKELATFLKGLGL